MIKIPDISKQIYKEQIFSVLENKYSTMGPMWVSHQMEWLNGVYASFKDHDKFLIVIYLIKKTLDFYSENFTKLTFDYFYSKETVEIEKYTITEISKALNIPKESTRRKVLELEKMGAIRKFKKKIIIDRSRYYHSKPVDSIKRITRFLSILSEMSIDSKILPKKLSSGELEIIIKDNFSYIWKLYYELQIPMMISYKKIFKDLETFHIFATCVVNQHLYVKKISKDDMKRDIFIESTYTAKMMQGLNAMSISDITGIPRATVIRKLRKLVKRKILIIDIKKHYRLTGNFVKKLKPMQKDILIKLSSFSSKIFNLAEF
jgi:DNA-binding Lrp family transcriptional regulator